VCPSYEKSQTFDRFHAYLCGGTTSTFASTIIIIISCFLTAHQNDAILTRATSNQHCYNMSRLCIVSLGFLLLALLSGAQSFTTTGSARWHRGIRRHGDDVIALSMARDDYEKDTHRREFLQTISLGAIAGISSILPSSKPALAAEEIELPTRETVTQSFDSIRYELQDAQGGVAYMQSKIDQQDFVGLMDFTKTYDLELRKKRMGSAKKLLQDKDVKEKATEFANAVTFDLIGINRSSRKGQENAESANKYLQELREDVGKFLSLESTIQVQ
jgi:hypothetical protein